MLMVKNDTYLSSTPADAAELLLHRQSGCAAAGRSRWPLLPPQDGSRSTATSAQ
jgi:hypothetical protein